MSYIDVQPATVAQVQASLQHGMIAIDDDVQGVANALAEISPELHLFYSEVEDVWIVMQKIGDEETLVTTAQECDHRLVHRCREVCSPGYDLAGEIEKLEAQREADRDYAARERDGEVGERLLHAIRKDKGEPAVSVILPRGVDG